MQSLLPFWAFPPAELAKRNAEAEKVPETFTLIVQKGKVMLQVGRCDTRDSPCADGCVRFQWNDDYSRDQWWASRPRADAQINLMEPFMAKLPDFRCVARDVMRVSESDGCAVIQGNVHHSRPAEYITELRADEGVAGSRQAGQAWVLF